MEKKLKEFLKTIGLRPKIVINGNMISMYWGETYFDNLRFSEKYKNLLEFVKNLENVNQESIGTSDGHFFFFTNSN